MTPDWRICKRKQPDGSFAVCSFRDLKKGDAFTLTESDGELVEGGKVFTAEEDARPPAPLSLDSAEVPTDRPWSIMVVMDPPPKDPHPF